MQKRMIIDHDRQCQTTSEETLIEITHSHPQVVQSVWILSKDLDIILKRGNMLFQVNICGKKIGIFLAKSGKNVVYEI